MGIPLDRPMEWERDRLLNLHQHTEGIQDTMHLRHLRTCLLRHMECHRMPCPNHLHLFQISRRGTTINLLSKLRLQQLVFQLDLRQPMLVMEVLVLHQACSPASLADHLLRLFLHLPWACQDTRLCHHRPPGYLHQRSGSRDRMLLCQRRRHLTTSRSKTRHGIM